MDGREEAPFHQWLNVARRSDACAKEHDRPTSLMDAHAKSEPTAEECPIVVVGRMKSRLPDDVCLKQHNIVAGAEQRLADG